MLDLTNTAVIRNLTVVYQADIINQADTFILHLAILVFLS